MQAKKYAQKLQLETIDKSCDIKGLSYVEIQQINALLANAASKNVKPAILKHCETVQNDGKNLMEAFIAEGKDKPNKAMKLEIRSEK